MWKEQEIARGDYPTILSLLSHLYKIHKYKYLDYYLNRNQVQSDSFNLPVSLLTYLKQNNDNNILHYSQSNHFE
jgi:hypothetical protein